MRSKTKDVDVRVFSTKPYDRQSFDDANDALGDDRHHLVYLEPRLDSTTVELASGASAVCVFVNDDLGRDVIGALAARGVGVIALRCAGFNNVDLAAAGEHGITVVRVPEYSPNAVAEHTLALILSLDRHIPRAAARVREGNFSLVGLVGFDLAGKTAGVVGTGKIGRIVARLLWHLRCVVLAHDPYPDEDLQLLGVTYVELPELIARSDVITLNCPLTEATHHLVDADAVGRMKDGVMLVNTGRGGLIDTRAVIAGLKSGKVGSLALDVYEEEAKLFFEDRSQEILDDDVFSRLLTFPNVLITAHQGFLTEEALAAIAEITLRNLTQLESGDPCENAITLVS